MTARSPTLSAYALRLDRLPALANAIKLYRPAHANVPIQDKTNHGVLRPDGMSLPPLIGSHAIDAELRSAHGHGFITATTRNGAGSVVVSPAPRNVTAPCSSDSRNASSTLRERSGSSSRHRFPPSAIETLPGRGNLHCPACDRLPPRVAQVEVVRALRTHARHRLPSRAPYPLIPCACARRVVGRSRHAPAQGELRSRPRSPRRPCRARLGVYLDRAGGPRAPGTSASPPTASSARHSYPRRTPTWRRSAATRTSPSKRRIG